MSSSCSQCCLACLCCCEEENLKGPDVRYSTIKQDEQDEPDGGQPPYSLLGSVEKLFSFPQEQSRIILHPEMFLKETHDPVTQQPTAEYGQQFRSRSESVTGADYATQVVAGVSSEQAIAATDSQPRRKSRPLIKSFSVGSKTASSDVSTVSLSSRQMSLPTVIENESWVLGLPVFEENNPPGQGNKPMLQFSLHYDIQQSTLMVHLHHASNLPAKDRQGTSDPFVVLHLTPNKAETFQSVVIFKTLNPVFDQSFQFQGLTPDDIRRQTLVLRIFDHDRFTRNDSIGMVALPLQNADLYGVVMRMLVQDEEEPQVKGKLLLSLSYDPHRSLLKGIVLKAADLKKQDILGQADPYIKIHLMHRGRRKKKWKSTVKKNTLTPIFNESFLFEISKGMNISDVNLEVFLMDYDRFSRNDIAGMIILGEKSDHVTGQKHWIDMLQSPQQSVTQWHSVAPPRLETELSK